MYVVGVLNEQRLPLVILKQITATSLEPVVYVRRDVGRLCAMELGDEEEVAVSIEEAAVR